jgi:tyrosinase
MAARMAAPKLVNAPKLVVSGILSTSINGSFMISTWAKDKAGEPDRLLDMETVLSRWDTSDCPNCQEHPDVQSHVHLLDFTAEQAKETTFYAKIHTLANPDGDATLDGQPIPIELFTGEED